MAHEHRDLPKERQPDQQVMKSNIILIDNAYETAAQKAKPPRAPQEVSRARQQEEQERAGIPQVFGFE